MQGQLRRALDDAQREAFFAMTQGRAVYGHPLEADVPVGALLSGGIEFALVCSAIRRLGGNVRALGGGGSAVPRDLVAAYGEPFACSSALAGPGVDDDSMARRRCRYPGTQSWPPTVG